MAMGEALLKVQEGLINGRKWLWDEAARKLGTLLSSPAAFEGEHFLQVNMGQTSLLLWWGCLRGSPSSCWLMQKDLWSITDP